MKLDSNFNNTNSQQFLDEMEKSYNDAKGFLGNDKILGKRSNDDLVSEIKPRKKQKILSQSESEKFQSRYQKPEEDKNSEKSNYAKESSIGLSELLSEVSRKNSRMSVSEPNVFSTCKDGQKK
ncbi:hypothetical protein N9C35_04855 [Flavobacteriaceae bacterium]|nr:hypothetical protein [Flavobacteriaceae bacterium]